MDVRKLPAAIGVIGVCTALYSLAQAQLYGPHFGASYGEYRIDETALDERDMSWKAFIGSHLDDWLGIEAAYVKFDRATQQLSAFEADGWSAAALVPLPIATQSALYAKGGAFWWDAQSNFAGVRADEDGTDPFWGAGVRLASAEHFSLRLEYERYRISDVRVDSVDSASIGLPANF